MQKTRLTAAMAAIVVAALAVSAPSLAQPYNGSGMMQGNGGGYGPGMMPGYGGGYGPGMMQGYGGGYGPGMMQGYGGGYGSGMMQGYGGGYGSGTMRGYSGNQGNLNLAADDVKNFLTRTIRNPNLKVGDVKEKDADTIIADVVTKDKDGLVQRFQINRHNGLYQPEDAQ